MGRKSWGAFWHYAYCRNIGVFLFFLLFYLFIYFWLEIFLNFTILYYFCQISKWIHHRYTCVPHPEPSSLLPPHTLPLGHPSAPASSIQYRALNLDWWGIEKCIISCMKWVTSPGVFLKIIALARESENVSFHISKG